MDPIVFSQEELSDIGNGLLALLRDASEAERLVQDVPARRMIRAYSGRIQELNSKICGMTTG